MKTYQVNTYMTIIFKRFVESLQHDYTYLTIEFFSTNQVLSKDTYRILYMLNEYSFGFSAQFPPGRVSSDFDCYSTNISCNWRGKKLKSGESGDLACLVPIRNYNISPSTMYKHWTSTSTVSINTNIYT